MKLLLSVITTLLQINGVMALLLVLFVISMREQNTEMIAKVPQLHNNPESFRRDLQETESDYQKQIQAKDQKLQTYDQEITRLKAELETYKNINLFLQGITNSVSSNPSVTQSQAPLVSLPTLQTQTPSASAEIFRKIEDYSIPSKALKNIPQYPQPVAPQSFSSTSNRLILTPINPQFLGESPPSREIRQQQPQAIPEIAIISQFEPQPLQQGHPEIAMTMAPRTQKKKMNSEQMSPSPENSENSPREFRQQPLVAKAIAETPRDRAIHLANDLTVGLLIAGQRRYINYGTSTYYQVQTAIRSLRKGTSDDLAEASHRSKLHASVLEQVAKWGAIRPGGFPKDSNQISLANVDEMDQGKLFNRAY